MKLTALLLASALLIFGLTLELLADGTPEDIGPEIIKMKMGRQVLEFKHWKHQERNVNECFHCHKHQEWKINKWDKQVAHEMCIACHDLYDKGPVKCKGCHKSK